MKIEQFRELVTTVKAGWPPDRIVEHINKPDEQKLILQCENGGYIRFALMLLPPVLLDEYRGALMEKVDAVTANEVRERLLMEDTPPTAIGLLHEKLLIQYTDDLEAPNYRNLGRHIAEGSRPEGRMGEAADELTFRVKLGSVLS